MNQFSDWFVFIRIEYSVQILIHSDWEFTSESLFIRKETSNWIALSDWKSIRARIDSDSFGLKITSDSFEFIRIELSGWIRFNQINFQAFFNKRGSKRFSDWFGLIRIGSDTDIGTIRNNSDSIRDFYPNESERIRSKFSIRMNQNQSGHGLIYNQNESVFGLLRIHLDSIFGSHQSVSGLILIHSDWEFTLQSFEFIRIELSG